MTFFRIIIYFFFLDNRLFLLELAKLPVIVCCNDGVLRDVDRFLHVVSSSSPPTGNPISVIAGPCRMYRVANDDIDCGWRVRYTECNQTMCLERESSKLEYRPNRWGVKNFIKKIKKKFHPITLDCGRPNSKHYNSVVMAHVTFTLILVSTTRRSRFDRWFLYVIYTTLYSPKYYKNNYKTIGNWRINTLFFVLKILIFANIYLFSLPSSKKQRKNYYDFKNNDHNTQRQINYSPLKRFIVITDYCVCVVHFSVPVFTTRTLLGQHYKKIKKLTFKE